MKPERVLIVDDKEENIYLLRTLLQGNGYEVEAASNGAEALDKARNNPPALIISDILMPVMDGFALCRECKKDGALNPIPFSFYTATYTDNRDQEFALKLGAERFIVKPQEPDVLLEMIRDIINKSRNPAIKVAKPLLDDAERIPEAPEEESVYLKQYNETLVRKLIIKMEQLEKTNLLLERDIAARTMAEAAMRESEERFRSLVEVAPEAIFVQSKGLFVFVNPAALKLFGASRREDLLGTDLMMRIAPEWRETVRERVRFQQETGKPAPLMEQDYLRLDGSRVPVETTAIAIKYQGCDSHLVFVRDVTERKHAEEDKSKLEAQLRQAQKMEAVGQLAGGIAHDFNNLLQVINGYTQLMLLTSTTDASTKGQLEQVKQAGDRAANLTRQLLTFSRREIQQNIVLDLNAIVSDMEKMLRRLIRENIVLQTTPATALKKIKADPGQLEQVIMNLVVNARDAMSGNGILTISTENVEIDEAYARSRPGEVKPGPYVMLAVGDTGCGMDENVKTHIFEPFFTTKAEGVGTGLGLATVYGIVKQSGGFIDVESELGKGTIFRVYLPQALERNPAISSNPTTSAMPRGTETILIVDDQEKVKELIMVMLQSIGYTVLPASHGAEALELARHHQGPIHILLSDVVMPGMSGIDLSKRMSTLCPGLKTLFMSGHVDDTIIKDAMSDRYIQKPIAMGDLSRKIREVLDKADEGNMI
ncbi:MAG: response regulator [Victivallales bacterium]